MVEQQHEWKRIQLNTFTRWVKQKLEQVNVTVSDLVCFRICSDTLCFRSFDYSFLQKTDFEEGLKLIRLVEVLSGKTFGRHNKKVLFRHQRLENISLALRFLENEEHIKLVNIGAFLFLCSFGLKYLKEIVHTVSIIARCK